MNYLILVDKNIIAKFENECDRDVCLDALQEAFEDCKFTSKDL